MTDFEFCIEQELCPVELNGTEQQEAMPKISLPVSLEEIEKPAVRKYIYHNSLILGKQVSAPKKYLSLLEKLTLVPGGNPRLVSVSRPVPFLRY